LARRISGKPEIDALQGVFWQAKPDEIAAPQGVFWQAKPDEIAAHVYFYHFIGDKHVF
jgi:hypothetical protein